MRPPPPLRDAARYPVTTAVAIAATGISAKYLRGTRIDALILDVRAFETQPWRLLTAALPHVSVLHLLFNLLWLWWLGTIAEQRFGAIRYAGLLVLLAAGSGAADYALSSGGVGLSGVVYGLFALLAILQRSDASLHDAVDERVTLLFVGWFFFCILTTMTGWLAVANVAHGAGAVLGALVAFGAATRGVRRAASVVVVSMGVAAALVGSTVARARVNHASDRGSDAAYLAFQAYERGDIARATRYGRLAVRMNPSRADWWYNLGLAARRSHDDPFAIEALRRSIRLDRSQQSAHVAL
ncbi:MAG: rhomboid family intramembrane serine protease, partial [Deltaproteobacteria bacterium]